MCSVVVNSDVFENIPCDSIGKYLLNRLKSIEDDVVINIDAHTGETLTCRELLEKSINVSSIFYELGLEKGDRVAIISENSIHYCVPILAGLFTGIVICPINHTYLEDELHYVLSHSKPKLIICSEKSLKIPLKVLTTLEFKPKVVLLNFDQREATNNIENKIPNLGDLFIQSNRDIDKFKPAEIDYIKDGALILMSSGTTGSPKCVLLNQQAIRANIGFLLHPNFGNYCQQDTIIILVPMFHIFGVLLQSVAIAYPIKAIIMNKFEPNLYLTTLEKYNLSKIYIPPSLAQFLAKSPLVKNYDLSAIREVIVGSAPISYETVKQLQNCLNQPKIYQTYGATEVGGPVTMQPRNKINKFGSVGILMPEMSAKVSRPDSEIPLGPLEEGELCFKTLGYLLGYIGDDGTIVQCLDSDGFYHTGDLGYYDEQHNFYVIDRIKDIIKYKSFQVSPSEIENIIMSYPGVKECAVVGIPDDRAGELPFAFVVKQNGHDLKAEDIIDYVAKKISPQKRLYGGLRFVNELPRNPTGKILKKELKQSLI